MKNYLNELRLNWDKRTRLVIAEAIEKKRKGEKAE